MAKGKIVRTSLSFVLLAAIAACAEPYPPTVTSADIADFLVEADRFATLPITDVADLPSGRIRYDGAFSGNVVVNDNSDYGLLGDMRMIVNFTGTGIGGRLTDINLLEDGAPNQRLGGSMVLSGTVINGAIIARAEGNLSAVSDLFPIRGDADIALTLTGDVVTLPDAGTGVYGEVSGRSSPGGGFTLSFENGQFYGIGTPISPPG